MIRKFLGPVALGSLFVGGLAVSHLALAQPGLGGPEAGRRGGLIAMADANKDGKVSKAELTAALDARFTKMDISGDGKLTKEDREAARLARLDAHFAALDSDRNGQISKAEFAAGHQSKAGLPDGDGPAGPGGREGRGFGRHGHHGHGMGGLFGGPGRGEAMKDGELTRAEFVAGPLTMFDKADGNKDGFVTADEVKAARQAAREAWQARRAADAPKN